MQKYGEMIDIVYASIYTIGANDYLVQPEKQQLPWCRSEFWGSGIRSRLPSAGSTIPCPSSLAGYGRRAAAKNPAAEGSEINIKEISVNEEEA